MSQVSLPSHTGEIALSIEARRVSSPVMPRQAVELRGEDRLIGAVVGRWILNWVLSPMTRAATSLSGGPIQPMPVRAFSVGPPLRSSSYDAFAVVAVMPHEWRRADCKQ